MPLAEYIRASKNENNKERDTNMILLDWRGFIIPQIYGYKKFINSAHFNMSKFEQSIIKAVGLYNQRFRSKYGELVICCDCRKDRYWRTEVFPHYKGNRDDKQLNKVFRDPEVAKQMKKLPFVLADTFKKNFQFKVLTVDRAEADDIIGTLVFANPGDKHLIISGDEDFIQLQRFNVDQIAPNKNDKKVTTKDPLRALREKLLTGDSGDGIPNVLSDADTFVTEGKRQTTLRAPKKALFMDSDELPESVNTRFKENEQLIDLSFTPDDITKEIVQQFEEYERCTVAPLTAIINLGYGSLLDSPDLFNVNIDVGLI